MEQSFKEMSIYEEGNYEPDEIINKFKYSIKNNTEKDLNSRNKRNLSNSKKSKSKSKNKIIVNEVTKRNFSNSKYSIASNYSAQSSSLSNMNIVDTGSRLNHRIKSKNSEKSLRSKNISNLSSSKQKNINNKQENYFFSEVTRNPLSPDHSCKKLGLSNPISQSKSPSKNTKINLQEHIFENPLQVKSYLPEELFQEAINRLESLQNQYGKKRDETDISLKYYHNLVLQNDKLNESSNQKLSNTNNFEYENNELMEDDNNQNQSNFIKNSRNKDKMEKENYSYTSFRASSGLKDSKFQFNNDSNHSFNINNQQSDYNRNNDNNYTSYNDLNTFKHDINTNNSNLNINNSNPINYIQTGIINEFEKTDNLNSQNFGFNSKSTKNSGNNFYSNQNNPYNNFSNSFNLSGGNINSGNNFNNGYIPSTMHISNPNFNSFKINNNNTNSHNNLLESDVKHIKKIKSNSEFYKKDINLVLMLKVLDLDHLINYFEIKGFYFKDAILLTRQDLEELDLDIVSKNRIRSFNESFNKHSSKQSTEDLVNFFHKFKAFIFNSYNMNEFLHFYNKTVKKNKLPKHSTKKDRLEDINTSSFLNNNNMSQINSEYTCETVQSGTDKKNSAKILNKKESDIFLESEENFSKKNDKNNAILDESKGSVNKQIINDSSKNRDMLIEENKMFDIFLKNFEDTKRKEKSVYDKINTLLINSISFNDENRKSINSISKDDEYSRKLIKEVDKNSKSSFSIKK